MSFRKTCFYLLPVAFLLSGCNKEFSYTYLIQHPDVLSQEYADCQSAAAKSPERVAQCEMVNNAVSNMKTVIDQAQEDPQQFGQLILDKEAACVQTKDALQQAQQSAASLKAKNASAVEIAAAEQKVSVIEQQYRKQHDEVKLMLAVLGLNSPE